MTQEDKSLLLKDLCTRLPYGVKCKVKYIINNETTYGSDVERECIDIIKRINFDTYSVYTEWLGYESGIEDIKPYLRPLSSMTEEEKEKLKSLYDAENVTNESICFLEGGTLEEYEAEISFIFCCGIVDWLNEHHFDFRNLIERGLAIDCTNLNIY